ncbi:MAG: NADH-quinone oxidoreductase subunit NuoH [Candidatus Omnitrophota bacterium]|jgi:NADH-quinone oxidoreductase subunit H
MNTIDQIFVVTKQGILRIAGLFLPEWLVAVKSALISIVAIIAFAVVTMMYLTWLERKAIARMQNRIGPNRVGKWGLLQPVADAIKMLTKEDIVPHRADRVVHALAPVLMMIPALVLFSVIPFGRGMTAVDLNIGVIFFIAVSSVSTLPIFMASWSSRNKYSLLGGMRTAAQMISYEVPMVLSAVPALLAAGTLSTHGIVEAQGGWGGTGWYVWTPWGLAGFVIFFLCAVAECNRSPFDLPEAESEIIAGFHTEYSGMKFALFYMAEFMNAFTLSALAATLFLGGWQGPLLPSWLWFLIKVYGLLLIMFWFRGTLPRIRVDQMMSFAWKLLLPLTLVNIFVAGLWFLTGPVVRIVSSVAILASAVFVFTRLNRKYLPEKRTYRFGD